MISRQMSSLQWMRAASVSSTSRCVKQLSAFYRNKSLCRASLLSCNLEQNFDIQITKRWCAFHAEQWPPNLKLAASILASPSELLLSPQKDRKRQAQLRSEVFAGLCLKRPVQLPTEHNNIKSYHDSLSSLVVEETLFTIVSNLELLQFDLKNKNQLRQRGVAVRVTDKSNGAFSECYTHEPLSSGNRNRLRAGSVVIMMSKGSDYDQKNITFGLIQYGSTKSQLLPIGMQDMKGKKAEGKLTGDRLKCIFFGMDRNNERQVDNDLEIHYVTSILNFQRQYAACCSVKSNSHFGKEILGKIANIPDSDSDDNESNADEAAQLDQCTKIKIPTLNDAQQKAADGFLSARNECIKLVQGPPGTGKTTMTVAIICRHIVESTASKVKRPLLVCGPTNKAVLVLARKVFNTIKKDDSINAILIGDKAELLSNNRAELESRFVYTYTRNLERKWKNSGQRLLREGNKDIARYNRKSYALVSKMKKQLPSVHLFRLERAVEEVSMCLEDSDSLEEAIDDCNEFFDPARNRKDLEQALMAVISQIRNLDKQDVVKALLNSADVIFCTLSATGSSPMRRMQGVSDLIVDEAGACTEAELLVALHGKPKRLLLVGDPKQLPATVQSPDAVKFGLAQSLLERLMYKNKFDYTLLNVQYRMRPEISQWPVSQFYDNNVEDGGNVQQNTYTSDVSLASGRPYSWVQVSGEEQKDEGNSTMNEAEANAIVALLLEMMEKHNLSNSWFSPDRIRIITFYKAQENLLRFKLKQYNLDVMVSTVDSSQGGEADIIILSFVRGSSGHMGFIKDNQRLNVAMTRAKYQLVSVGNVDAIAGLAPKGGNLVLRDMAKDALSRCHIVPSPGPLPPPPKRAQKKIPAPKKKRKEKKPKMTNDVSEK